MIIIEFMWLIWFIAGVVLMVLEIFTTSFFTFLIGVSCFAAGTTALITKNLIPQFIVFIIFLAVLLIFVRPLIQKYFFGKNQKKSNIDALIGKIVIVDTEINNIKNSGYIKDGADYWKAKSKDGAIIKKGEIVIITSFEGITATVKKK